MDVLLRLTALNLQPNIESDIIRTGDDVDFTGALGAISRSDIKRMDAHAELFYEEAHKLAEQQFNYSHHVRLLDIKG